MLVLLLMYCTSQKINYGLRIKQQQYMEMARKPKYDLLLWYARQQTAAEDGVMSSGVTRNSDNQCCFIILIEQQSRIAHCYIIILPFKQI